MLRLSHLVKFPVPSAMNRGGHFYLREVSAGFTLTPEDTSLVFVIKRRALMSAPTGVWGIDIGQCALKAVRLEMIEGKVTATAFDYVEHPKILSQPDADPDQLTREALEKFLSRNDIKGDSVAVSVSGQSAGLARFVKLPPVEEKKIGDIVRFEAKQQIPFPLDEVVWDYQKITDGVVEGNFLMDVEIGLFAMKRDMISRVLSYFQGVNVEVHFVQMTPLALCNFITYDILNRGGPDGETPPPQVGKKKCVVSLDIGTDASSLIITDGGKIIWQRPIPLGGNHFTRSDQGDEAHLLQGRTPEAQRRQIA